MAQAISFENEHLRVEVWPSLGGKISSVLDKADHFELLFKLADDVPQHSLYDHPYADSWFAGWDECFPSVAAANYPLYPYQNIRVPDHGELWALPTVSVPTKNGITSVWHGLRFGYRLTRKLSVEGPTLSAEYTLVNLAPFEFRFVWAAHALMAMPAQVHIDLPSGAAFRFSHGADQQRVDRPFDWPALEDAPDALDLSRPSELPPGRGWKLFSTRPSNRATVHYGLRRRHVEFTTEGPTHFQTHWGIWINTGGWVRQRHFAIEPTTGRFDAIDRSIADNSAARVGASEKLEWSFRWTVGAD